LDMLDITDAGKSSYQYQHINIPSGNLFYRIKQTDKDGFFIYSNSVLLINKEGKNSFAIFPNPAGNYISISTPYNSNAQITIELYDAVGKKLTAKKMLSAVSEINTMSYPSGTYTLRLISNHETITKKVIVKH
jgi:hypothetical protein